MIKIAIVDTLGLCYDGSTLNKRGLGGSESAVILVSRELASLGFDVTVFNDCYSDDSKPGEYNGVLFEPLYNIVNYDSFDIFIGSRSVVSFAPDEFKQRFKWAEGLPNLEKVSQASKHKILWMHDTFCDGDDLIEDFILEGRINEIFTLSDWHTSYVTNCDHGKRRNYDVLKDHIFQTRNGITVYHDWVDVSKKDPNLFVYNASLTKGMMPLVLRVWPIVKQNIPEAKLKVIGGFYRFRSDHGPDQQEQDWRAMVDDPIHAERDIEFTGIISQKEIADIMCDASYMIYPAAFPETFGISTLEALAYNTPLITCNFGALEETAIDIACWKINYPVEKNWSLPWLNEEDQIQAFARLTIEAYHNKYLHQQKMYACNQIKHICSWSSVALQWKQHFYRVLGEFLPISQYRKVSHINSRVRKVFGRRFTNKEEEYISKRKERKICVVTPVFNSEEYISNCIRSVASQDYDNYEMYIINDASTDKTLEVIENTIRNLAKDIQGRFIVVDNKENVGAVCNQITTIRKFNSDSIVMLLDGDDWLVNNPNIFHMYNALYYNGAQYTYGSCWSLADNIPLIAQPYPPEIKEKRAYRDYKFNWNFPYPHLRTFVAGLLSKLDDSLFKDENGEWYRAGGDVATFYNIIEQADPKAVVYVPDIVYNYNDLNPINDYKVNGIEQNDNAAKIISHQTPEKFEIEEKQVLTNIEEKKKKILIGIPTAKYIEPETFKSIYDLYIPSDYEVDFQFFYGYNIDQIRNLIASWITNGPYDYLFSVDSDIIFPKDTLCKLLMHDKDVVTGIYRQRLPEQIVELYDKNYANLPYQEVEGKDLVEIGGCGFGCVLIKKQVMQKIGYPQFEYHSAISHNDTISEDVDFCRKARQNGFSIWCDATILCGHKGANVYNVEPSDKKKVEKKGKYFERLNGLANQPSISREQLTFLNDFSNHCSDFKIIYDIGACTLNWTKAAKAFWPSARFFVFDGMDYLKEIYEHNDLQHHCGVLSDKDGRLVNFYQNPENPSGNSYYRENIAFSTNVDKLYPLDSAVMKECMTLDSVIKKYNFPRPHLMKITVQGSELDVLKGASETLLDCDHIIVRLQHKEFNSGGSMAWHVIDYLEKLGFKNNGAFVGDQLSLCGDYYFRRYRD